MPLWFKNKSMTGVFTLIIFHFKVESVYMNTNPFYFRRNHVTLIEMLIVMSIIALISGIVMVSLDKALVEQRFRNEVGKIINDLRLAQDLMMILGMDVHVKFSEQPENRGIEYKLETETKINKSLQHLMLDKPRELSTIRGVFFDDEDNDQTTEGTLDIKFLSRGAVMSRGVMRLSISSVEIPVNGVLDTYIELSGQPQPIFSNDYYEIVELDKENTDHEVLIEGITLDTIQRLPEKVKQLTAPPVVEEPSGENPPGKKNPKDPKIKKSKQEQLEGVE